MSDDRATLLLHRELDGELDAASQAELAALLVAHPAVAVRREELRSLDSTLRAVRDAEPLPAGLARRIAGRVVLPRKLSLLEQIQAVWHRPMWVPAATFAMGLAVAAALYPALEPMLTGADATHMTGTLLDEPTRAGLMPHARLALALDPLQGMVTLAAADGNDSLLEFDLTAPGPVDVVVDLRGSGLEYAAIPVQTGVVEVIAREADRMTLRSQGQQYFALPLRGPGAAGGSVKVEFSIDGHPLSTGVLAVH